MRIVSWNCGGRYFGGLTEEKMRLMMDYSPDILVIQECTKTEFDVLKTLWTYKNWYGDDYKADNPSNQGLAVFSNVFSFDFPNEFNRNFRYVVPYCLTDVTSKIDPFVLLAVWTKGVPLEYDQNITEAVSAYQKLISENAVIIGDFNTGYNKEHEDCYSNLVEKMKGFKNCVSGKPETFKNTFYHATQKKFYLNDFCFVSDKMFAGAKEIQVTIPDGWNSTENGSQLWRGLSDHCPIIVDFDL